MTVVECLAALGGVVLGWGVGGLLNRLHSMRPPAALTAPVAPRPPSHAPSEPEVSAELTRRGRSA